MTEKPIKKPLNKKVAIIVTSTSVLLLGCTLVLSQLANKQEPNAIKLETITSTSESDSDSIETILSTDQEKPKSSDSGPKKPTNEVEKILDEVYVTEAPVLNRNESLKTLAYETYQEEQKKIKEKEKTQEQPSTPGVVPPVVEDPILPPVVEPPTIQTSTPVISNTNPIVLKGTSFNPYHYVSVYDELDSSPQLFVDTSNLNLNAVGVYSITLNALNKFNVAAVTQTMYVTVVSHPTIKVTAESLKIDIGSQFDPLAIVAASDEMDGDLTTSIQVIENNVESEKEGSYTVKYRVMNSYGYETTKTITIEVVNELPVIEAEDLHVEINQPFNPFEKVKAISYLGKEIELLPENEIESNVDISVEGEYYQIFKVQDEYGKYSDEVKRKVVVENEAPVISNTELILQQGDVFDKEAYCSQLTVTDREDDRLHLAVLLDVSEEDMALVTTDEAGTYDIQISATDSMGKTTSIIGKIIVEPKSEEIVPEEEPPVLIEETLTDTNLEQTSNVLRSELLTPLSSDILLESNLAGGVHD